MRRAWSLLVVLLAVWFVGGVATAGPAAAHAELVATDPAQGARLDQPPDRITLTFSEPVTLGAGYARLLEADGTVHLSTVSLDGDTLTLVPRSALLDDQGYLVTYRLVSADSHPVAGAFSFAVGNGKLLAADADAGKESTDPLVAVALPLARWLGYAGLALAVGVPLLVLLCWPAGWGSVRLRRLAVRGAAAVVAGALLAFLLQGPYAAGSGIDSLLDPALLSATASSVAGWTLLARILLAAGLALALLPVWRRGEPPRSRGRLPRAHSRSGWS